jgi:hypothetical protein
MPMKFTPTRDDFLTWLTEKPRGEIIGSPASCSGCPVARYIAERRGDGKPVIVQNIGWARRYLGYALGSLWIHGAWHGLGWWFQKVVDCIDSTAWPGFITSHALLDELRSADLLEQSA